MQAWRWALAQLTRRLWLRASLYGVAGVAAALLAAAFSPFVPDALAKPFGGGTVNSLLNVLASSLLSVATFSAAAMLTAYTNVSQGATPRAAALGDGDSQAQGALASFIGAFLYSVVAFSALGTGYYANGGRAILFGVTLLMLAWVAITLLRWLDQLLSLAQVGHATGQWSSAPPFKALQGPFGVGLACEDWSEPPDDALAVEAGAVGYVRNVDLGALRAVAAREGLQLWVVCVPGGFAHAGPGPAAGAWRPRPLDAHSRRPARRLRRRRRALLRSGTHASASWCWGEIASRALSPGINDPGTAVDVIGTAVRLLTAYRVQARDASGAAGDGSVLVPPVTYADLLDDVFRPIASDGASSFAVAVRLQKALAGLAADAAGDAAGARGSATRLSGRGGACGRQPILRCGQDGTAPLGRRPSAHVREGRIMLGPLKVPTTDLFSSNA